MARCQRDVQGLGHLQLFIFVHVQHEHGIGIRRGDEQPNVTISLPLEGGSLITVTASAYRFRELVRQLRDFEESLPAGKPS